jgi:Transposase IS116/IS110/IS902 family
MIRVLRVARRGAMKACIHAGGQLDALIVTAPEPVRDPLRRLTSKQRIRTCASLRPGPVKCPAAAVKTALRALARRWQALQAEIDDLDTQLTPLVSEAAPGLLALPGVGVETAGQLLVTAGDNRDRLRSEASFARLCGAAPIPVSSGRTDRHRLHRGGDRQANSALWRIALVRMGCHQPTKDYVARRTAEGKTKTEIMDSAAPTRRPRQATLRPADSSTTQPLDRNKSVSQVTYGRPTLRSSDSAVVRLCGRSLRRWVGVSLGHVLGTASRSEPVSATDSRRTRRRRPTMFTQVRRRLPGPRSRAPLRNRTVDLLLTMDRCQVL